MNVDDFVFDLPEELIASHPAARRDASRLLVARRGDAGLEHRVFRDLAALLQPGDVLVRNDSRVIPARLLGRRTTGGRAEVLLLHPFEGQETVWRAMVRPAKKLPVGARVVFAEGELEGEIVADAGSGERIVAFHASGDFRELLMRHGLMPLPPYIIRRRVLEQHTRDDARLYEEEDRERYQTVYARAEGSVAAPTAGLHFTPELLGELESRGVEVVSLTLHVGAGTFQGMAEGGRVEDHHMHSEEYEVPEGAAEAVTRAVGEGRRVIAVGTTSVRTLESAWDEEGRALRAGRGSTRLMIAPGYRFRVVDGMVTNFHLPRSTLLLLVSAYLGRERLLDAYREAVRERYRFFSYGDAMLMLP